ncbi:flagellar biosynthetic protein FliO [Alteromonas sediminis]|uniref:Flagellar protein n=1 Tax=Alteromonas sediminis TaxID=2259342 RepID=A0A3N5Y4G4_9ALTE|nr:flagellar biosynthetic protein FliO [Alteromonas sediminis]
MLLAKSRESKNLDKSYLKSIGYYSLFSLFSTRVSAQESASPSTSVSDFGTLLSISLSLFVVLALIFGLAYLMRRFTVTSSGNGQMKVVASMMAGAKERIMVLQVGDEQHLIGITPNNINHLSTLKAPLETQKPTSLPADGTFKDKLVEAMAARIKPEKKHD